MSFIDEIGSLFRVGLIVILSIRAVMKIFVEILIGRAWYTLLLIIIKVLIAALNALFSCGEWLLDRAFKIKWVLRFLINIIFHLRV
jgi:hypothetical protein